MNNSGPVMNSAGPYFLTIDPPVGIDPLLGTLVSDSPSGIRGTDPISAAIGGVEAWQKQLGGVTTSGNPTTPATAAGSPWYTRGAVLVLAVLLVAIGTLVIALPAVKGATSTVTKAI